MDICWNYFTSFPGHTWSSGASYCASEGAYLMELEKQSKYEYIIDKYLRTLINNMYCYEVWVRAEKV